MRTAPPSLFQLCSSPRRGRCTHQAAAPASAAARAVPQMASSHLHHLQTSVVPAPLQSHYSQAKLRLESAPAAGFQHHLLSAPRAKQPPRRLQLPRAPRDQPGGRTHPLQGALVSPKGLGPPSVICAGCSQPGPSQDWRDVTCITPDHP